MIQRARGSLAFTGCACCLFFLLASAPILADPCVVNDNGSGTVKLPPEGCEYLSPDEVHEIVDGLPPGTTLELAAIHKNIFCPAPGVCDNNPRAGCTNDIDCNVCVGGANDAEPCTGPGECPSGVCSLGGTCQIAQPSICTFTPTNANCTESGGSLGGERECAESILELSLTGTGDLAGFSRTLSIPVQFETHTAPRTAGNPVQTFPTDMFRLQGEITGDPDFDLLKITSGSDFSLPSPGHTTLTQLPGGNWHVDSFFDITYEIEFQGAPGSVFDGMFGTTTSTLRMEAYAEGSLGTCCISNGTCEAEGNCQEDITREACDSLGGSFFGAGFTCADVCVDGNCIPTVSQWGLVTLLLLVMSAGTVAILNRQSATLTA